MNSNERTCAHTRFELCKRLKWLHFIYNSWFRIVERIFFFFLRWCKTTNMCVCVPGLYTLTIKPLETTQQSASIALTIMLQCENVCSREKIECSLCNVVQFAFKKKATTFVVVLYAGNMCAVEQFTEHNSIVSVRVCIYTVCSGLLGTYMGNTVRSNSADG